MKTAFYSLQSRIWESDNAAAQAVMYVTPLLHKMQWLPCCYHWCWCWPLKPYMTWDWIIWGPPLSNFICLSHQIQQNVYPLSWELHSVAPKHQTFSAMVPTLWNPVSLEIKSASSPLGFWRIGNLREWMKWGGSVTINIYLLFLWTIFLNK